MTKKKLTLNQQRRIDKSHRAVVDSSLQGLVICNYGQYLDIENDDSIIIRCHLRKNVPELAVGDRVIYELEDTSEHPQTGIITKLLKRKSLLSRNNKYKANIKPIAANVDQLFIVFAPKPEPQSYLIDQFLIIAESSSILPILLFNKSDMYKDLNRTEQQEIDQLLDIYTSIGYQVIQTSGLYGKNISDIQDLLKDKTSIFVGQSGVGKSTITKQLVSTLHNPVEIKTGEISEKTALGKHTTSTSRLYHIDNLTNSYLIDSPGIREMGVSHLTTNELESAYIEFRSLLSQCKFRDCKHQDEPSCAFKQALAEKAINTVRWSNYKKFSKELNVS